MDTLNEITPERGYGLAAASSGFRFMPPAPMKISIAPGLVMSLKDEGISIRFFGVVSFVVLDDSVIFLPSFLAAGIASYKRAKSAVDAHLVAVRLSEIFYGLAHRSVAVEYLDAYSPGAGHKRMELDASLSTFLIYCTDTLDRLAPVRILFITTPCHRFPVRVGTPSVLSRSAILSNPNPSARSFFMRSMAARSASSLPNGLRPYIGLLQPASSSEHP